LLKRLMSSHCSPRREGTHEMVALTLPGDEMSHCWAETVIWDATRGSAEALAAGKGRNATTRTAREKRTNPRTIACS